jgi:LEA14-like dessication related protein
MIRYLFLLLPLILLTSSCKMLFKAPEIQKIQDVRLSSFSPDRAEVEVSIIVHNPNNYEIQLNSLRLDILDKDRLRVGTAELARKIDLPKKKGINLDMKVVLLTRPLIKNVSNINHDVQFFIAGKGDAKAMGIAKRFDFEEPYSLSLKEHLQKSIPSMSAGGQDIFKLTRTYVEDFGLGKSMLSADFILMNPYGFSFNFRGFPAEIFIDGKKVGRGQLKSQLRFDENVFYKEGTMSFELSNLKSLFGATKGAFKGEIQYTVKGTIILDAIGMELKNPFEFSGKIPVSIWDLLLK